MHEVLAYLPRLAIAFYWDGNLLPPIKKTKNKQQQQQQQNKLISSSKRLWFYQDDCHAHACVLAFKIGSRNTGR